MFNNQNLSPSMAAISCASLHSAHSYLYHFTPTIHLIWWWIWLLNIKTLFLSYWIFGDSLRYIWYAYKRVCVVGQDVWRRCCCVGGGQWLRNVQGWVCGGWCAPRCVPLHRRPSQVPGQYSTQVWLAYVIEASAYKHLNEKVKMLLSCRRPMCVITHLHNLPWLEIATVLRVFSTSLPRCL